MNRDVTTALAWGGGMIAVALAATVARQWGYLDADTVTRVVLGMNGLAIAHYGNRLPKTMVPAACARRVLWVGGWAMVLSGLVSTGLYAFAPMSVAVAAGTGAIAAGVAVTAGYSLWLRSRVNAT